LPVGIRYILRQILEGILGARDAYVAKTRKVLRVHSNLVQRIGGMTKSDLRDSRDPGGL